MFFSVKEMEAICVLHNGTFSKTLAKMRDIESGLTPPLSAERKADVESAIKKMSVMKPGDMVCLAFEPEN